MFHIPHLTRFPSSSVYFGPKVFFVLFLGHMDLSYHPQNTYY